MRVMGDAGFIAGGGSEASPHGGVLHHGNGQRLYSRRDEYGGFAGWAGAGRGGRGIRLATSRNCGARASLATRRWAGGRLGRRPRRRASWRRSSATRGPSRTGRPCRASPRWRRSSATSITPACRVQREMLEDLRARLDAGQFGRSAAEISSGWPWPGSSASASSRRS